MKIQFEKMFEVKGLKPEDEQEKVTYGELCKRAILFLVPSEENKNVSGQEKYKRYKISKKIDNKEDITAEEIAIIKSDVGRVFTPMAVGMIWDFLEGVE